MQLQLAQTPGKSLLPLREELGNLKFFPNDIMNVWAKTSTVDLPETSFDFAIIDAIDEGKVNPNSTTVLTNQQEKYLFLKYNFVRYLLVQLSKRRYLRKQMPRIESLWAEMTQMENYIVSINMPLAIMFAKRASCGKNDIKERISENACAILRAARSFNPAFGFKFSTYACQAILQQMHRYRKNSKIYASRFTQYNEENPMPIDQEEVGFKEENTEIFVALRHALNSPENPAKLTDKMKKILKLRWYGKEKTTLEEVGKKIGLTKERIRQIENQAIALLKEHFTEQNLTME